MPWKSIRLELAATPEFPSGSASRAYILRLPLHPDGTIDGEVLARAPQQATVRRLWPNEPDLSGHAALVDGALAFVARQTGDQSPFSWLDMAQVVEGMVLPIRERGGDALPFRCARVGPPR